MKIAQCLENRLDQAALEAHLTQLDRSIEIKTDQPTIPLTKEELYHLEEDVDSGLGRQAKEARP